MNWKVELQRSGEKGGNVDLVFPNRPMISAGEGWVRVGDSPPSQPDGPVGEVWFPSEGIEKVRVVPDAASAEQSGI